VVAFDCPESEIKAVGEWLAARAKKGIAPQEMGVFVRSGAELARALAATEAAGLPAKVLDDNVETTSGRISIGIMHLAINVKRTKALLRDVIAAGAELSWVGQVSANLLRDEELLDLIAASGGRWIFIGMESLDPANHLDWFEDGPLVDLAIERSIGRPFGSDGMPNVFTVYPTEPFVGGGNTSRR